MRGFISCQSAVESDLRLLRYTAVLTIVEWHALWAPWIEHGIDSAQRLRSASSCDTLTASVIRLLMELPMLGQPTWILPAASYAQARALTAGAQGGTSGRYHVGLMCEKLYEQVGASTSLRLQCCFTPKEASRCLPIINTSTSVQYCFCINTALPQYSLSESECLHLAGSRSDW